MSLRIPGKTFLVGEYAVLVGGEALGLATKPLFTAMDEVANFNSNSPAGLYLKSISNSNLNSKLSNPYEAGGFGYSTAEFLSCWFKYSEDKSFKAAFTTYGNLFEQTTALKQIKPSGADLATQMLGNITYFNPNLDKCESLVWPFSDLSFFIVSTGLKVATHEHLAKLDMSSLTKLKTQSHKVIEAFKNKHKESFLSELKIWIESLTNLGLQHNNSLSLKSTLEKENGIILVKPNGALGVDTLTVFFNSSDKSSVQKKILSNGLKIQASELDLTTGASYVD